MTIPTLDKAIECIEILHNIKPGNINDASNFLTELQKSNYAWSIADQLLYLNRDLYCSYFGAQTIRNKIQLHFEELPLESHNSLKESLMTHLNNISGATSSTVTTQLSLALADLFCHMVAWNNGIDDIINAYSHQVQTVPVLLDVLRYISEEFSNRSLRLGVNRKTQLYSELDRCSRTVVSIMDQSLTLNSESVFVKSIECLNSWFLTNVFSDAVLLEARVVSLVFDVLKQPDRVSEPLFKAAAQCATDFFSNDIHTIPQLIRRFQAATYDLSDAYRLVERSRPDFCMDYGKIIAEMSSALLPFVLESPDFDNGLALADVRTLRMLLMVARSSRDCCGLVLDVLIDATDNGVDKNHRNHGTTPTDTAGSQLAQMFHELINIMTLHCAPQSSSNDNNDEQSLGVFRSDVFFVMEQIRTFVDMEAVFRQMLSDLAQLVSSGAAPDALQRAEAVLCMIGSVVKFVNTDGVDNARWTEQLLMELVLPSLSRASASFRDVAFIMFGELCRWACARPALAHLMIREMTSFVLDTPFDNGSADTGALASALQALSLFCRRQPATILQEDRWVLLVRVCQRFPTLSLVPRDMASFYEALGRCLSVPCSVAGLRDLEPLGPNLLGQKLLQLCQINIEAINELVRHNRVSRVPRDPADPCVWADNVSGLFMSMPHLITGKLASRSSDTNHQPIDESITAIRQPFLLAHWSVMEQYLWPVLSSLIDCFIADGRVLERVVRILRYTLRCFQTMAKPLLGSIATKIVQAYAHSKESCFLYIGGILVDEFGYESECRVGLVQMFHAFSGTALVALAGTGLHENPNTTEDLFRLMVRLVQRCSPDFLAWQELPVDELLYMAVRAIIDTNIDAKALALRFLLETFQCACNNDPSFDVVKHRAINWLLDREGLARLWQAVLHMCRWHSDELTTGDLVDDMADLLVRIRLILDGTDRFLGTLDAALSHISVTRRDGMVYATEAQISQFRCALLDDSHVLEALETFAKLFS